MGSQYAPMLSGCTSSMMQFLKDAITRSSRRHLLAAAGLSHMPPKPQPLQYEDLPMQKSTHPGQLQATATTALAQLMVANMIYPIADPTAKQVLGAGRTCDESRMRACMEGWGEGGGGENSLQTPHLKQDFCRELFVGHVGPSTRILEPIPIM